MTLEPLRCDANPLNSGACSEPSTEYCDEGGSTAETGLRLRSDNGLVFWGQVSVRVVRRSGLRRE